MGLSAEMGARFPAAAACQSTHFRETLLPLIDGEDGRNPTIAEDFRLQEILRIARIFRVCRLRLRAVGGLPGLPEKVEGVVEASSNRLEPVLQAVDPSRRFARFRLGGRQ